MSTRETNDGGEARRKQAGEDAQSGAENLKAGEGMTDREPYNGALEHGDTCTLVDGRPGKIVNEGGSKFCVATGEEGAETDKE